MNMQDVLAKIDTLPPMPAVAVKLLEAAQDPDVELATAASWIERDPAMTANLLHLCNSPFYGLRTEVTSIRQATSLLGMKKVVQVALTVLSSAYLAPPQEGYALEAGALWKNSVASALAAELIAGEVRYPKRSTAYTAGLLQDMGKIVLAEFVGQLLPAIRRLTEDQGLGWEAAERQVVGIPHPEVGAILLERWGFPAILVESVRFHHTPALAALDPNLVAISHLADALTMSIGMGLGADGLAYVVDEAALQRLRLNDRDRMDRLIARLSETLRQAQELLAPP